jgi:hypothetical protein
MPCCTTSSDVGLSLREVLRLLRPGGRFAFAGEPTSVGDGYAHALSTLTWRITTNVTKLPGLGSWRRPQAELDEFSRAAALEAVVDLHTFTPGDLERMAVSAGAVDVQTATVEFTAAMLGWPLRTFEYAVPSDRLGWGWAKFAFYPPTLGRHVPVSGSYQNPHAIIACAHTGGST